MKRSTGRQRRQRRQIVSELEQISIIRCQSNQSMTWNLDVNVNYRSINSGICLVNWNKAKEEQKETKKNQEEESNQIHTCDARDAPDAPDAFV